MWKIFNLKLDAKNIEHNRHGPFFWNDVFEEKQGDEETWSYCSISNIKALKCEEFKSYVFFLNLIIIMIKNQFVDVRVSSAIFFRRANKCMPQI